MADNDPIVLGISVELGAIADELGNRHEARKNMSRVARYGPAVLGPAHPYVQAAERFLGVPAQPVASPEPEAEPAPVREPPPQIPGVYRPEPRPAPIAPPDTVTPPEPPPEPEPVRRAPAWETPPEAPRAAWAPQHRAEPAQPPADEPEQPLRLEHSALPWYQRTDPEPVEPFPAYQPSRFDDEEPHRTRTPLIALGVFTLAAVVAAVVVGLVVLVRAHPTATAGAHATESAASSASTAPGAPPTDVKLRDDGGTVTLTWTDPSHGTVPFFVEVGKPGAQLQLYGTLPQGETTYRIVGLNPRLDYCFSVIAVYGTNVVAPSDLVCTRRGANSGPSPNR
jgi:Fibronectin type III domain